MSVLRRPASLPGALDDGHSFPPTILVAAWFGLLAGLGEGAFLIVRRGLGILVAQPLDALWMAPLLYVTLFLMAGLGYHLLERALPPLGQPAVVTLAFSLPALIALVTHLGGVHIVARLLLAMGLAYRLAQLVERHPHGFALLVRVSIGWITLPRRLAAGRNAGTVRSGPTRRDVVVSTGVAVGALALGLSGLERPRRRARVGRGLGRPNVLLIVWDTVRSASVSLQGYSRRTTPTLERLARSAVTFDAAIAPSSWTLPSHASFFTGRWAGTLSAGWTTALDAREPTLGETLAALGYATAGFVGNLHFAHRASGLARGFAHFEDFPRSIGQALLSIGPGRMVSRAERLRDLLGYHEEFNRRRAASLVDALLVWREQVAGQPYFAFLNLYDAHAPYLPPDPFATRFVEHRPRGHVRAGERPDDATLFELRAAYDGAIVYLDHVLDSLLSRLGASNELNDTLLILLSDHGEEFDEHGIMGHGFSLYLPSIHVPLVMRFPRGEYAGRRVGTPVSLRDLPTTILDVVEPGSAGALPGHSLLAPIDGRAGAISTPISELRPRPWIASGYPDGDGDIASVVHGGMHYLRHEKSGREELYAIDRDYWERDDLAAEPDTRDTLARMRALLDEAVAA